MEDWSYFNKYSFANNHGRCNWKNKYVALSLEVNGEILIALVLQQSMKVQVHYFYPILAMYANKSDAKGELLVWRK